ncbi:two-component system sensor histidine kinase PmrB [Erwinia sorbitola]|uniref:histidine kinase n=1 Tax=Erwinia sorbitola TaxID=2681984 RepID=A0A6I6ENH1_9GAMM|nr:two-component system sensor histidine kinase PmrB [Erwinia sorbitola]MTD27866.1 two-component system sensor histidine kinase PmrB [Erwinia sorbitola]QGU86152.1 two-component system sensor histidine kinase PmrB [Erwinia sorbitola]
MNSMRRRLMIMLALILMSCQLMSAFWLWHESREQISFLVNETLSAHARNEQVENEIREAIASLLLPSLVMVGFTLLLSFWAISWIIRPLRALQTSLVTRSADNLSPLPLYSEMDEIVAVTGALNQLLGRLDHTLQQERLFTADAAHELRTPLAGLRLHLELLEQEGVKQGPMLVERIDQLMHVIEQLLMLSRAGQALASGHYQTLNWHDIIDPLRQEMDELLALRQQQLIVTSTTVRTVQGDAVLLRLMLRNLLENASRYSPEGSTITLLLEDDKDGSRATVRDEGTGIDAAAVNDAIKAFRRMDQRYGGSGLGLNIVQRIVQIHHGELSLTNRSDRSGLNASCWLPENLG